MPIEVVRHKCNYCKKTYALHSSAVRHEKNCFANAANKACRACACFEVSMETVYVPYHGGNPGSADYETRLSYCSGWMRSFDDRFEFKNGCTKFKPADKPNW